MWIFTETGFVSAVAHRDDNKKLMVRARDKKSLEELSKIGKTKITTMDNSDYPHRVVVSKELFKKWMDKSVDDASYDNFKNQVEITRGYDFAKPLHHIWAVMHQVEDVTRGHYTTDKAAVQWWDELD